MSSLPSGIKKIRVLNFFRRILYASQYYNYKYFLIFKWGFTSKEDTNYTYDLTDTSIKYLAHTVSVVTGIDYNTAMKYILEPVNNKELIENLQSGISNSRFNYCTDSKIRFGRRLGWYAVARASKPECIVEAGVDKGLGSALLCSAILKNMEEGFPGKYYGIDINPEAGYLLSGIYKTAGEFITGDSIQVINNFDSKIDLFISDSDHSSDYEYREYIALKAKLSDGAIILGDDAHTNSFLSDFSRENNRKFLFFKDFPDNHWYPGAGIGFSY
jgi:hypothetical protein